MEDTTRGTPALPPRAEHVQTLARIIKEVALGSNGGEAVEPSYAEFAEAILEHQGFSGCHDGPAALPAQGEVQELVAVLHSIANDAREAGQITDAEYLTRTAILLQQQATTPPPLPPDYIDPEHQGEDRKLLEAFYVACRSEGGTADKLHLRGIRAVLALRPTVAAVRAADAAIADEAIEAEFRAWWKAKVHPLNVPRYHAVTTHIAWGRHLLSRGKL